MAKRSLRGKVGRAPRAPDRRPRVPGAGRWLIAQDGWQEIAKAAADRIEVVAAPPLTRKVCRDLPQVRPEVVLALEHGLEPFNHAWGEWVRWTGAPCPIQHSAQAWMGESGLAGAP